jgi:ribosomal protein L37AE/L43A
MVHTVITVAQLAALEALAQHRHERFADAGSALVAIRAGKGHELRGYVHFTQYCEEFLGVSVRHAQRLMQAAGIVRALAAAGIEPPRNEAVVRALAPVAHDQTKLLAVCEETVRRGATPATATAAAIAQVVREVTGRSGAISAGNRNALGTSGQAVCPACKKVPVAYSHQPDGTWVCVGCGARVALLVNAAATASPPPEGAGSESQA